MPAVQWALNTAYREIYTSIPYHVMFGQVPLTSFSTLASSTREDRKVDALEKALQRKVVNAIEAQQRLHKVVEKQVKKASSHIPPTYHLPPQSPLPLSRRNNKHQTQIVALAR